MIRAGIQGSDKIPIFFEEDTFNVWELTGAGKIIPARGKEDLGQYYLLAH